LPETFFTENFLTTLRSRRIASGTAVQLYLLATSGESLAYTIAYHYRTKSDDTIRTGSFVTNSGRTATATSVVTLNITETDILAQIATADAELVSYTVTCGQRSATFFIDRNLDGARQFAFRNCFNVLEVAQFQGVTTAKTDVDRSVAVVNGVSSFYNQQSTKTYEVEVTAMNRSGLTNCSLRYSYYGGWRNIKLLASGECRKVRDVTIFSVNGCTVFL
jgi:hypothetical protein